MEAASLITPACLPTGWPGNKRRYLGQTNCAFFPSVAIELFEKNNKYSHLLYKLASCNILYSLAFSSAGARFEPLLPFKPFKFVASTTATGEPEPLASDQLEL